MNIHHNGLPSPDVAPSEDRTDTAVGVRGPEEAAPSRGWFMLGVLGFALMAAFWIWAFFRGSGVPHPDEFALPAGDTAADLAAASDEERSAWEFIQTAELVCADAQAEIAQLPLAISVESFEERADVIDRATDRLAVMIDDLERIDRPVNATEGRITGEWLSDYDQFLGDRRAYTETLRAGEDPPFEISARDGRRVTNYIVTFAEVNRMESCIPPGDVG